MERWAGNTGSCWNIPDSFHKQCALFSHHGYDVDIFQFFTHILMLGPENETVRRKGTQQYIERDNTHVLSYRAKMLKEPF